MLSSMRSFPAILLVSVAYHSMVNFCAGFSLDSSLTNLHHSIHFRCSRLTTTTRRPKGRVAQMFYQKDGRSSSDLITTVPRIDTSFLEPHQDALVEWLNNLQKVERSPPLWVGPNLLRLSSSEVLQDCLTAIMSSHTEMKTPKLFSDKDHPATKYQFDWAWRYCLMKLLSQEHEWNNMVAKQGMSNTHPLRLQVVAIPARTSLPPHAHPAVELDIPLLGTLYEDRASPPPASDDNLGGDIMLVDPDLLDRAPEHSLGTPLSDFSPIPTTAELQAIGHDVSQRVSQEYPTLEEYCKSKHWHKGSVEAGQCLVNKVGSVHRSYTREEPCLLFVLGPNVHAHFVE